MLLKTNKKSLPNQSEGFFITFSKNKKRKEEKNTKQSLSLVKICFL